MLTINMPWSPQANARQYLLAATPQLQCMHMLNCNTAGIYNCTEFFSNGIRLSLLMPQSISIEQERFQSAHQSNPHPIKNQYSSAHQKK